MNDTFRQQPSIITIVEQARHRGILGESCDPQGGESFKGFAIRIPIDCDMADVGVTNHISMACEHIVHQSTRYASSVGSCTGSLYSDSGIKAVAMLQEDSTVGQPSSKHVVLSICNQPVVLQEDWKHGIGGGLWSTGLALAKYLDTSHAQQQLVRANNPIQSVLELGSGNGFLAVCLLAAHPKLQLLVATDTAEHLPLIQSTIDANASLVLPSSSSQAQTILVQEYLWGTGSLHQTFDLIIGSDVAYRDELHDPLIRALMECSHSNTIILLGVTMNDTKPQFFSKLTQHGFAYERLADHCLDPSFRGTQFAIFVVQRRSP